MISSLSRRDSGGHIDLTVFHSPFVAVKMQMCDVNAARQRDDKRVSGITNYLQAVFALICFGVSLILVPKPLNFGFLASVFSTLLCSPRLCLFVGVSEM